MSISVCVLFSSSQTYYFHSVCLAKVDVNLCPDKRQLMLQWERPVLLKVKAALLHALGGGCQSTVSGRPRGIEPLASRTAPTCSSRTSDDSSINENLSGEPVASFIYQLKTVLRMILLRKMANCHPYHNTRLPCYRFCILWIIQPCQVHWARARVML